MTKQQSDSFAQQQSGQAAVLKGLDRDKNTRNAEDTVLGYGKGLASDTFEEIDGVPKKTQAQDAAEHGAMVQGGAKSEAEQQRERAALEAEHRRQRRFGLLAFGARFSPTTLRKTKRQLPPISRRVRRRTIATHRIRRMRSRPLSRNAGRPGSPRHSPGKMSPLRKPPPARSSRTTLVRITSSIHRSGSCTA